MSLVELLVGMAIGLLVALAATSSLVFVRLSAASAEDAWRLQQESNTAFRIIGWQIRQAGARPLTVNTQSGTVEFLPNYAGFGVAGAPQSITGTNGPAGAPDTLQTSVGNDAAADARDCLGLAPNTGAIDIRNQFSTGSGDLSCTGVSATASFSSGVEDMQVWYGESSDTLVQANALLQYKETPANWNQVTAIMVCLRLVGERQLRVDAPSMGCKGETVPADGRMRRTFTRVFRLRNAVA